MDINRQLPWRNKNIILQQLYSDNKFVLAEYKPLKDEYIYIHGVICILGGRLMESVFYLIPQVTVLEVFILYIY